MLFLPECAQVDVDCGFAALGGYNAPPDYLAGARAGGGEGK